MAAVWLVPNALVKLAADATLDANDMAPRLFARLARIGCDARRVSSTDSRAPPSARTQGLLREGT
jgi:hypothetical protein